jgi:hypothetical protein
MQVCRIINAVAVSTQTMSRVLRLRRRNVQPYAIGQRLEPLGAHRSACPPRFVHGSDPRARKPSVKTVFTSMQYLGSADGGVCGQFSPTDAGCHRG